MMPPLRVLIVEDSEADMLLLLRQLRRSGYDPTYERVDSACAMQAALDKQDWDVVLSDYALPGFGGLAALEILRSHQIDIPFIIVSGAIGEETAVAAMKAGAHDYVMKNNLNRLAPAIERELREADERRARQQAETQIQRLSRALEQSASLVVITDRSGIIQFVNSAFTRITGYSQVEVFSQNVDFLQQVTYPPDKVAELLSAISIDNEWRGELRSTHKNGDEIWVSITMSPIKNSAGTVTELLYVGEDITGRKQMEAELQRYTDTLEQMVEERTAELHRAKDQIEVILNNSSDAIALAEATGDIQKTNPAFQQLFGDRVDQAIEQFLWVLVDESQIEPLARSLLSVIYDNNEQRVEASIIAVDGRSIDADVAFAPVREDDEPRAGVILSLRDITHLKELDRFKTRFVANATHDLSNPIAAMKLRLYLLQKTPEKLNDHLVVIERQLERLDSLVGELRMLSELDRGKLHLDYNPLDLNGLLSEVIEVHRPLAENKNQQLAFQPAPHLLPIMADIRKCERIVVNLVVNALNYTPSGGAVQITTHNSPDAVVFSVSDNGMGIPAEDLPHIFERFYRAESAQKQQSGTGLGLAIVKEIVELHGGRIAVESVVDEGTTFTVSLPLNPPDAG